MASETRPTQDGEVFENSAQATRVFVVDINGDPVNFGGGSVFIEAGTNIVVDGDGSEGDPYVISQGVTAVPPQVYTFFRRANLQNEADFNHALTIVAGDTDYSAGAEGVYYSWDAGDPTNITILQTGIYNIGTLAWAINSAASVPQVQPRVFASDDLSDGPSLPLADSGGYQTWVAQTNYIEAGTTFSLFATNASQMQYASFRIMKIA